MRTVEMESVLEDLGDCGPFQVIFVLAAFLPKSLMAFSLLFMSFGNYNPGWKCLDDNVTSASNYSLALIIVNNSSTLTNKSAIHYTKGTCELYKSCRDVEFNPESSTVVTEWNLLCDRSWIASTITSSLMLGVLVGSYLTGYLGDRFGRKHTLLPFVFAHGIISLMSLFSVSWPMFAVAQFFNGMLCAAFRFLPMVYSSEFVSPKWRVPIVSVPAFAVSGIFFAVSAMVTKDWRQIQIVMVALSVVCVVVMIWLPRSIRWLAVNNKKKEVFKVTKRISRINRRPPVARQKIEALITRYKNEDNNNKKYSFFQLFRKGTKLYSFIIGAANFVTGLTYFVISFGIKSLPGNIYTNLMILLSVASLANLFASVSGNVIGRKKTFISSFIITTTALFGVVAFTFLASGVAKDRGIIVLAIIARIFTSVSFYITATYMIELFPTVIRSSVSGWGSLTCQIGGTIAPFLIPNDDEAFYISYLAMGGLNLMCCFFFFFIPETAGKALQDTWTTSDKSTENTATPLTENPNSQV